VRRREVKPDASVLGFQPFASVPRVMRRAVVHDVVDSLRPMAGGKVPVERLSELRAPVTLKREAFEPPRREVIHQKQYPRP